VTSPILRIDQKNFPVKFAMKFEMLLGSQFVLCAEIKTQEPDATCIVKGRTGRSIVTVKVPGA
jgi:hypothetical protein